MEGNVYHDSHVMLKSSASRRIWHAFLTFCCHFYGGYVKGKTFLLRILVRSWAQRMCSIVILCRDLRFFVWSDGCQRLKAQHAKAIHVEYLKLAPTFLRQAMNTVRRRKLRELSFCTLLNVRWRYDGDTTRLRYDLPFVQMGPRTLETTR
jgi:hypothetical protein